MQDEVRSRKSGCPRGRSAYIPFFILIPAKAPLDRTALPRQSAKASSPSLSGRNYTLNYSNSCSPLAETEPPPAQTYGAVYALTGQCLQGAVNPRTGAFGSWGICRKGGSFTHHSRMRYACPSRHAQQHGPLPTLNDGKRFVELCHSGEADHTAFQEITVGAVSDCTRQPLIKGRTRGCVATVVSAASANAQDQSSVPYQCQRTHRRCGEVHKCGRCRGVDQTRRISSSTPREHAANRPRPLFILQYPGITCGDGNGDVKPDHPSGPGTYGHAL